TLAFAQTYQLTGQAVDEKGEPVPFASIYPRNAAHTGTSANSEGLFKLNVTAGTHELVVRSVGYRQAIEPSTMDGGKYLQVTLFAESYLVDEVVIGRGHGAAHAILRPAIRRETKRPPDRARFTANVRITGVQRLRQARKNFVGVDSEVVGREI